MTNTRGLLPCSKCGACPDLFNTMDNLMQKQVKLRRPRCEDMLQTKKEENEMKDVLELVNKIEELLKKSKFVWFMAYDPKEKAWNFQIKEK